MAKSHARSGSKTAPAVAYPHRRKWSRSIFTAAVLLTFVVVGMALVLQPADAPAAAQGGAPPVTNIEVRNGLNPGEVVISWDAVPQATHYRIGYVNMEVDYHLAKASCTGEWIEAFVYVDVNARNILVSNGRAEYTVRRIAPGARHAFTVLTSNNFVDTGNEGSVNSEFFWPSNPRWQFLPGRDSLPRGITLPSPKCTVPAAGQTAPPSTDNIAVREAANSGEVVISWDAVPQATHYRIGYVNMEVDYHLAKASCTGEWIEAFVYVDVNARNIPVSNGRAEHTVRGIAPGARHAFTVLTSNNFVDTGNEGSVNSEFFWPSNPRWQFLPGRDTLPLGMTLPTPYCSRISGDFTSEGVNVVGALPWHEAGYRGQGVKVGIIETGFEGFTSLIGQELPSPEGVRCYTDAGTFSSALKDCENGDVHGTATAEAIIDTAPGATLYIAIVRNKRDLRDTVNWMVEEGVSVAALYGFGRFEGPGDGTSPDPLSALGSVDLGVDGGIMFVVPAGNFATGTWFKRTPFSDADGDTFIDFASNDDGNDISLEKDERAFFQLRWDDTWAAASHNLGLHIWDTATQQYVAHSKGEQSGRAGDVPYETLRFQAPRAGVYKVAISRQDRDVPEWIQLLYWGQGLEHYTESGSIINPAESANPGLLTVGGAHWDDIHTIAWYSSRGPTPDGRIKPDIVGPTCGESASYHPRHYCGTSGAAPHLVGMATLVKQRFPQHTPEQVAEYLKKHAEPRQTPSPNNTWGHGFAVLPSPDAD